MGRDSLTIGANPCIVGFNPRARVGRDELFYGLTDADGLFQSTRPRGARHMLKQSMLWLHVVSIHAPAWGATLLHYCKYGLYYSFNPRARVGRDAVNFLKSRGFYSFNPRARVGRDGFIIS